MPARTFDGGRAAGRRIRDAGGVQPIRLPPPPSHARRSAQVTEQPLRRSPRSRRAARGRPARGSRRALLGVLPEPCASVITRTLADLDGSITPPSTLPRALLVPTGAGIALPAPSSSLPLPPPPPPLSIRPLAAAQGGRSSLPGVGSTFTMTLPSASRSGARPRAPDARDGRPGRVPVSAGLRACLARDDQPLIRLRAATPARFRSANIQPVALAGERRRRKHDAGNRRRDEEQDPQLNDASAVAASARHDPADGRRSCGSPANVASAVVAPWWRTTR